MKYTEIEITAEKLCPFCIAIIRALVSLVLIAFGKKDYTIGTKEKSEDDLIREAEDG